MRGEGYLHLHLGTRIGVGNGLYFGEKVMMNFVTVLKEYRTTSWARAFRLHSTAETHAQT